MTPQLITCAVGQSGGLIEALLIIDHKPVQVAMTPIAAHKLCAELAKALAAHHDAEQARGLNSALTRPALSPLVQTP